VKWLQSLLTLAAVLTATFFLLRLAPGGPFDTDRVWPEQVRQNLHAAYGLDQPLLIQWSRWMKNMATGNWGESLHYQGQSVAEIVSHAMVPSAVIGIAALWVALCLGAGLAVAEQIFNHRVLSSGAGLLAALGQSLPAFFLASMGVWIFAVKLQWLPVALLDSPLGYFLPIAVTAVRPAAWIYQLMRDGLCEQMKQPYIRYALAKGLSRTTVVMRHATRNTWASVLGVAGPLAANLLTGSFVVEWVFQVPGLGKHFVTSVLNRDYPLVMGVTVTYGVVLLILNRLTEWAMERTDPRIKT
jgi:oligopeptide transport system permease protein